MSAKEISTDEENFKASPLGFLMAVVAKYQAYSEKAASGGDSEAGKKAALAADILDNMKIELSKTDSLKKELSNEAVMMHVVESLTGAERETVLECVFQYLSLLESAVQNLPGDSPDRAECLGEYYDVSRLGLILNCYLGDFTNDDFFYGVLAEMAEAAAVEVLSDSLVSKIQCADIDLSFRDFLKNYAAGVSGGEMNAVYNSIIRAYSESLLEKVLKEDVGEEEINKLACAKQIQRIFEKELL